MSYNPNRFSVSSIINNQAPGSTMTMSTSYTAPSSSFVQEIGQGPSISGPTQAMIQQALPPQSVSEPWNGAVAKGSEPWHGTGMVSVNPNATIVHTPGVGAQLLNPYVNNAGLANLAAPSAMAPFRTDTAPVVPNSQAKFVGNQVPNYYNIEQTPSLQAYNQFVEQVPGQVRHCEDRSNRAAYDLLQRQHRTGNGGALGMNGVTSNEYLFPRLTLNMNRPPSNQVFPPLGIPGNGPKQPVVRTALKNRRNHEYCPEMYMTPYDRTQNKIATGVLTNPYTGEVFQTFEEGMPLPQRNDSLLPSQFRQTNPKLVALQGGIDYNAPPPSKQEIAENVPLINGGPNVWGDALYQPQLREWFNQRAVIEQFNNRNGILPNYGIHKEHPAGFIGPEVNYLRPTPYNPATMRNSTTNNLKGWTLGVDDANWAGSMDTWNVVKPIVNNLDPNRGQEQTYNENVGPVVGHGDQVGVQAIQYDTEASLEDLRATLKTLQETAPPVANVVPDVLEGYMYNPGELKATNKLQADTYPYVRMGQNAQVQEGSMYQMQQDAELRGTNKVLFQVPVPTHNVAPDLPHTEIDLTAPSEKTETRRQYYSNKGLQAVSNVIGDQYTAGVNGPQPYAEWTRVAKRGGTTSQTFRVVPNRTTDSLSNQGNFSPGCSERDIYPEQPFANMFYGSFVRPSYGTDTNAQQMDFGASMARPIAAETRCFKEGDGLEQDVSRYTLQPMALSQVGSM